MKRKKKSLEVKRWLEMTAIMAQREVGKYDVLKNVPITNIQFYKKKLLIIINGGYGKHKKWRGKFTPTLRPCLVWFFFHHSISVTHHPSLITRHSSLITLNIITVWHHHSISITKYLSHYLWAPYLSLIAGFFFFFNTQTN